MRRGVGTLLGLAAVAALLTGCPAGAVAPSLPPGVSPLTTPSNLPSLATNTDLYGVVSYDDHVAFHNPLGDPNGSGSDQALLTINVALKKNPSSPGEFVDAGSTFTATTTSHREVQIGTDPSCLGISDGAGSVTNKTFGPPTDPDDPGSKISAIYTPELNFFTLWVDTYQPMTTQKNACMSGQAVTETHYVGGPLSCASLGLGGVITVDPAGPDHIDLTCFLKNPDPAKTGSVTVSGTLTLNN